MSKLKISPKTRADLRSKLIERDKGIKCHYCEIEEKNFAEIWKAFSTGASEAES